MNDVVYDFKSAYESTSNWADSDKNNKLTYAEIMSAYHSGKGDKREKAFLKTMSDENNYNALCNVDLDDPWFASIRDFTTINISYKQEARSGIDFQDVDEAGRQVASPYRTGGKLEAELQRLYSNYYQLRNKTDDSANLSFEIQGRRPPG